MSRTIWPGIGRPASSPGTMWPRVGRWGAGGAQLSLNPASASGSGSLAFGGEVEFIPGTPFFAANTETFYDIPVTLPGTVVAVRCTVVVRAREPNPLSVQLKSPTTALRLLKRAGGPGVDLGAETAYVLGDGVSKARFADVGKDLEAHAFDEGYPQVGDFQAFESFSTFNGVAIAGTWRIRMRSFGSYGGYLDYVKLEFLSASPTYQPQLSLNGSASGSGSMTLSVPVPLNDTFTGADGTAITARNSDSGHSWNLHAIDTALTPPEIRSNRCAPNYNGANVELYSSWDPVTADYDVDADFYWDNTAGVAALGASVIGRADPTVRTLYWLRWDPGTTQWQLIIYQGGSTFTPSGGGSQVYTDAGFTSGVTRHAKLKMRGTTIEAEIDGVTRISFTDNHVTAKGKAGIMSQGDNYASRVRIDNVAAVDA